MGETLHGGRSVDCDADFFLSVLRCPVPNAWFLLRFSQYFFHQNLAHHFPNGAKIGSVEVSKSGVLKLDDATFSGAERIDPGKMERSLRKSKAKLFESSNGSISTRSTHLWASKRSKLREIFISGFCTRLSRDRYAPLKIREPSPLVEGKLSVSVRRKRELAIRKRSSLSSTRTSGET